MSSRTTRQRLALAICDFLTSSLTDGTLPADDKESIDISVNLIAETFKVDPADPAAVAESIGQQQNLLGIYSVYEKLRSAGAGGGSGGGASSGTADAPPAAASAAAASGQTSPPTDAQIQEADSLKSRGNAAMAARDYPLAIRLYTEALGLNPGNAVYLSNRAAAHSAAHDNIPARADAEAAVAADPTYAKAWSRLGLACFALGDPRAAMDAYRKGMDAEGGSGSEVMRKGYDTARRRVEELERESSGSFSPGAAAAGPDLGGLASLLGGGAGGGSRAGGGGAGGGGGLDAFSGLMGNPMFASMAQNLMGNPDLMRNLMENPRLREMANQFGSGGSMPDLGSLMSDPRIAELAKTLGGGGGAGAGGAGGRGPGGGDAAGGQE